MDLKSRQIRLVFVDPEDEDIAYWWPALIVPVEEFELFKETMDTGEVNMTVGDDEQLVCYFEDGSFSIVPKSGLVPFNPSHEPFKSYSNRIKHFATDAGVRRAVNFHDSGLLPKLFKWLILAETGYLEKEIEVLSSECEEKYDNNNTFQVVQEDKHDINLEDLNYSSYSISTDQVLNSPPPPKKQKTIRLNVGKRGRKPTNVTTNTTSTNTMIDNNTDTTKTIKKSDAAKKTKTSETKTKTKTSRYKSNMNVLDQFDLVKLEALLTAAKEASLLPSTTTVSTSTSATVNQTTGMTAED